MGIIAYQIGIIVAIQIASLFGKGSRNTAVVLIIIFTLLQVYTSQLMILQFITIVVAYLVSNSLICSKKKQKIKTDKVHHISSEKTILPETKKTETLKKDADPKAMESFKQKLFKIGNEQKSQLKKHIEFNLKDFRKDLKSQSNLNSVNNAIEKTKKGITEFKRINNPLNSLMNFEKYIILHELMLEKLKQLKSDYDIESKLINVDDFTTELMAYFVGKTNSCELNIKDYRNM